jgi:aryl-alcohol dehydrogenase-like predicted oxidoreductase
MIYRRLGKRGVRVSEVSVGGWLTHGRTLDDRSTERVIQKAFDLGVNFFDTADAYHQGEGERALGKALADFRRDDLVIATKCYFPMSDRPNDRGLSRKHIFESVHNSLKRLRTDYIDLYQFHRYDPETPVEESVRAIEDLIRQGKVLYWGVSEWSDDQINDAVKVADYGPSSNQPIYNMLNRYIEDAVMPTCEKNGMGLVVFSPLAQGVLTGKYQPGQQPPDGSRGADDTSNNFMKGMLENDQLLANVQRLRDFANAQGYTLAQLALAWCLRRPEVSSVITGASSPEQVEANVKASGLVLDDAVWKEAEAILS